MHCDAAHKLKCARRFGTPEGVQRSTLAPNTSAGCSELTPGCSSQVDLVLSDKQGYWQRVKVGNEDGLVRWLSRLYPFGYSEAARAEVGAEVTGERNAGAGAGIVRYGASRVRQWGTALTHSAPKLTRPLDLFGRFGSVVQSNLLDRFSERSRPETRIAFAMRREGDTQRVMSVLVRAMT